MGACGTAPAAPQADAPSPHGAVVARVGSEVIDVEAVRAYLSEHGGSARDALRALEDDALLRHAAQRSGWAATSDGDNAYQRDQLLAQRVLLDLEREHPLVGPTGEEVAAFLDTHREEIVREEQRDCVQVLVQLPPDASEEQDQAAHEYATRTLTSMADEGVEAVWAAQPSEHQGLSVVSQYLPPATPSTDMPDVFRSVVFALDAPGPVAVAVRTPLGWHAIAVTGIHPPIRDGSPAALRVARERLVTETRREAFDALVRVLAERFPVTVSRGNAQAVLPLLGDPARPGT